MESVAIAVHMERAGTGISFRIKMVVRMVARAAVKTVAVIVAVVTLQVHTYVDRKNALGTNGCGFHKKAVPGHGQ